MAIKAVTLMCICMRGLPVLCFGDTSIVRPTSASDVGSDSLLLQPYDADVSVDKRNVQQAIQNLLDSRAFSMYGSPTEDVSPSSHECSETGAFACEHVRPWVCTPFDDSPCSKPKGTNDTWKVCGLDGDDEISTCHCRGQFATCCGNLTRIPKFRSKILYLNFSSNNLTALDDDTLENVTQLKWLTLSQNSISVITENTFKNMRSLECLELVHNNIRPGVNAKNFTKAVNKLKALKLLATNFTEFEMTTHQERGLTYILKNLMLSSLIKLFVSGSDLEEFHISDIYKLTNLQDLSLASHNIREINPCKEKSFNADDPIDDGDDDAKATAASAEEITHPSFGNATTFCRNFSLPSLRVLDIAYNLLVTFPNFCSNKSDIESTSVVPNLTHLSLSLNAIVNPKVSQMRCLPKLKSLALTGNPLRRIKSRVFQNLPSLFHIDLRFTNVMFIDREAFNHSTLSEINVQSSNWFFDRLHTSNFDPDLFVGSNLSWVDLSYNVFRFVTPERLRQILYPLRTARNLYMAELGLFTIPDVITSEFRNLTLFWFNANLLSKLERNTFENLTQLTYVDLRDNILTNPDVEAIRLLQKGKGRKVTVKVNLSWNPFSCSCELLRFLKMLKGHFQPNGSIPEPGLEEYNTDAVLAMVGNEYRCYSPSSVYNMSLFDLKMADQMCLLTTTQLIIIHCVCIAIILTITVYSVLYRYRWQTRFWLYSLHVRWTRKQNGGQNRRRARFSAFVSYCQYDSNFVLTQMLPALEGGYRIPLCIHERDFIPGRYISQNIVERMEESNHVILVLSNAFLQDDWCRFELFVAQQYGLVHRRIPITIFLLEPLRVELMDAHVIIMLQSPSLEWPRQECGVRAREMFWRRLGESLTSAKR